MDTLRHLHYFATVAEEGHVGRAAARLTMAQPPLSQALARLERSLGVLLFHRGPRGMTLTEAGRVLLPRARALLDDERAFRRIASGLADAARAVRLGVVPALGPRFASDLTTVVGAAHDGRTELVVAPTRDLVDAVTVGEVHLALVSHPAVLDPLASGGVITRFPDLVLPAGHPAAQGVGPVPLDAVHDLAPALPPRSQEPAAHDLLLDALDLRGCTRSPLEVGSPATALAAVATGQAFLLTVDPDLDGAGVSRRQVACDPVPMRFRLVWRDPGPAAGLRDAAQRWLDHG